MDNPYTEVLLELMSSVGPMLLFGTLSLLGRTMRAAEKVGRHIGRSVDRIWEPEKGKAREKRFGAIAVLASTGLFLLVGITSLLTQLI